ncbi:uncharacterized protein METZ01_LOCUS355983, partial [marine metagenome]
MILSFGRSLRQISDRRNVARKNCHTKRCSRVLRVSSYYQSDPGATAVFTLHDRPKGVTP